MKTYISIALVLMMTSCVNKGDDSAQAKENAHKSECLGSSEIINGDTVNMIDCHGKRQGKWVKPDHNDQDSIWNHGDTLYFEDGNLIMKN